MEREYRIYHKVGGDLFSPYRPGDELWFDPTPYRVADLPFLPGSDPTPERLADAAFARHNRDDRPDGRYAPSLSVGDVVCIDWNGDGTATFWAVERFGWSEVEGPDFAAVVNNGQRAEQGVGYSAAFDLARGL